jgi:spermidine synthase
MRVRTVYFLLLLLLLAGSGCAALIYEIVWFQLLQLVIGSSGVSLGLLLAAYMGGLCAGSILLPRYVSRRIHPLKAYAALELGIGILGLLVLFAVPIVARLYVEGAPDSATAGFLGLVFRGIVAGACLLPPTFLMAVLSPQSHAGSKLRQRASHGSDCSTAPTSPVRLSGA